MSRWRTALPAALLALVASACGASAPAEDVPELVQRVAEVDAAAVARDPGQLDAAVADLVATVDDAEAAGELDADEAERIRAAAESLLAAAPEPDAPQPAEPSVTQEPSEGDEADEESEESEEDAGEEDSGSGEGDGHGKSRGNGKGKGAKKD